MCQVNFVQEFKAQMQFAREHNLSSNERNLCLTLLDYFNNKSTSEKWTDGFLPISNKELAFLLGCTEQMLVKVRTNLLDKDIKLFEFIPGAKNTCAPQYKMLYLTCQKQDNITTSELTENPIDKPMEQKILTARQNIAIQAIKQPISQATPTPNNNAKQIIDSLQSIFNRELTAEEIRHVIAWESSYIYSLATYTELAKRSINTNYPIKYMHTVLLDWYNNPDHYLNYQKPKATNSLTIKPKAKQVSHQIYNQRTYENEDFNYWVPPSDEPISIAN